MAINMVKLPTQKQDLVLRVAKGHFATSHSHINYYIDREIYEQLKAYADEKGQTMTTAIERILKQFFEKQVEGKK